MVMTRLVGLHVPRRSRDRRSTSPLAASAFRENLPGPQWNRSGSSRRRNGDVKTPGTRRAVREDAVRPLRSRRRCPCLRLRLPSQSGHEGAVLRRGVASPSPPDKVFSTRGARPARHGRYTPRWRAPLSRPRGAPCSSAVPQRCGSSRFPEAGARTAGVAAARVVTRPKGPRPPPS